MARAQETTTIQYFRTGLYTHRSQLFAPIRSIGINIVQMKDALIDGQDMEVTDLLEVQRRPGFSRFCSVPLGGGEIPNQFYSFRDSIGTVFPCMDSNTRFANFSASSITTLWTKPSADQAFAYMVGRQLYIANGTANGQKRYDLANAALHTLGIPGPATAPTVTPPVASGAGATFWQPATAYANGLVFADSNGNIEQANGAVTTGAMVPLWSTNFGTNTNDGTGKWLNLGPPGTWQAAFNYAAAGILLGLVILDSNGNIQQLTVAGTSGSTPPVWSTVVGNNTTDSGVTWKCLSNSGAPTVFSGYIYVYTYSTQAPTVTTGYYHCSTASPSTTITGTVFGTYNYPVKGAFSTNTDVTSVDIYRIKDGGSVLNYAGSVVNNTAGGTWTFNDNLPDTSLNTSVTVPLAGFHINDVPPGTNGTVAPSTDKLGFLTYWMGRLWGAAANKVYFDAGADCQNGDPHASWPPANVFVFPGQVIAMAPTSAGLLVFLADAIKMIAGGPQTLSFYPSDLLDTIGISSANCLHKDGDIIRIFTTQGQQMTLSTNEKTDDGNFIADQLQTFPPASSYLAVHRNGLDSGVFLGDGSTNMFRYGINIGSWSTIYKPVNGIKAIRSVETSTGIYTLCAGRATGGGFILGRNLTTFQDDGQNYSNCFATVGNFVLSEPGQTLVPVLYIAGFFAATGSIPAVSVLPNEISGTSGIGFIPVPNPQEEPNIGQTVPSSTLMAKLWNLKNVQTMKMSLQFHHLQVKIAFPPENKANTIKVLSLQHEEHE